MSGIAVKLRAIEPLTVERVPAEPLRVERLTQSAPHVTVPGVSVIQTEGADAESGDGIAVIGATINLDIASLPLAPTS